MKLKIKNLKIMAKDGQALLELSIFGSMILLLLGVLISYGLNYNFQQQAQMEAYRKALEISARPELDDAGNQQMRGSASYTIIKDRHIPSPESPFGVGSVQPVMASASVTRDPNAGATASDYDGLPKMIVHMQGKVNGQLVDQERSLATAGIRREIAFDVPCSEQRGDDRRDFIEKYSLIYGSVSGWNTCDDDDETNIDCAIEIVDSVEGEVVDYNSAIRQARLIVDQDFCRDQCEKGKRSDSEVNCSRACVFPIQIPWYVQGAWRNGSPYSVPNIFGGVYDTNDSWEFPNIENLFTMPVTGKRVQGMGIQPDVTQQITTNLNMRKTEDNQGISTTDTTYWDTATTRTILYNNHLNQNTGEVQEDVNKDTENYSTHRGETESATWQTDFSR